MRFKVATGLIGGFVAVAAITTISPAAFACFSGLLLTPTTDTVAPGGYSVEYQTDASVFANSTYVNTQYGVAPHLEMGIDFNTTPNATTRMLANIKYVVSARSKSGVPIAFGVYNAAGNLKSIPYVVAGTTFGFGRLHLGAEQIEGKDRWFAGFDRPLSKTLTFLADYTSGHENSWSGALNWASTDRLSILAGVGVPRDHTAGVTYSVHWVMSGGGT